MSCLMFISMTECDVLNLLIAMGFGNFRLSPLKSFNRNPMKWDYYFKFAKKYAWT